MRLSCHYVEMRSFKAVVAGIDLNATGRYRRTSRAKALEFRAKNADKIKEARIELKRYVAQLDEQDRKKA